MLKAIADAQMREDRQLQHDLTEEQRSRVQRAFAVKKMLEGALLELDLQVALFNEF